MIRFIAKRVLLSLPLLFIVSCIVFLLVYLTPGDAAVKAAGGINASAEAIAQARERLGLNDPFLVQYGRWAGGILRGDLGTSLFSSQSVTTAIVSRLPITLSLTFGALLVALVIAVPAGIVAALRPGSVLDRTVVLLTSTGIATPSFFVGLILVLLVALQLDLLPATGYTPLTEDPAEWVRRLILPSIALGVAVSAELTRYLRASMRDVLQQDYIRTAVAKGLPRWKVVVKHALKNAAIPVVTVLGLQTRTLLGGTVVIETVFALNGVGTLAVQSVFGRDLPMIQGIAVASVIIVLLVNLVVDASYGYFNPRVRAA